MTKPELGTKRLCTHCGARYYGLNKTPITCPKCNRSFEVVATTTGALFEQKAAVNQPAKTSRSTGPIPPDSQDTLIKEVDEEDTDLSDIIGKDVKAEENT